MRTLAMVLPATIYTLVGLLLASMFYADTVAGRYPWADHMPVLAVLVGVLAATLHILGVAVATRR